MFFIEKNKFTFFDNNAIKHSFLVNNEIMIFIKSNKLMESFYMDLSIIIINYNTRKLTAQAINSILTTTKKIQYEIIVVDNSSIKLQQYRPDGYNTKVKIFLNVENKGFGHACNYGLKYALGKYILFLNSDTIMHKNTLDKCVEFLESQNNVGAMGVRVMSIHGKLDHGCKRGFPTPLSSLYYFLKLDKIFPENKQYGHYRKTFIKADEIADVDAVSGSMMIVPKVVLEKTNGFDETFFMYGEDLDLCFRIKEKGYRVVYNGQLSITHLKGQSGLNFKSEKIVHHFYNSMKLFYKKHYIKKYNFAVTAVVYIGIWAQYRMTLLKMKLSK